MHRREAFYGDRLLLVCSSEGSKGRERGTGPSFSSPSILDAWPDYPTEFYSEARAETWYRVGQYSVVWP